jgi:nucleoside-diphosphate-sugar epimerase
MGEFSFEADLEAVRARVGAGWQRLRGAHLFVTGATGFIGRWLLESLRHSDVAESLGVSVTILTRDIEAFKRRAPELARWERLRTVTGDIRSFDFPEGYFSHLIHAATEADAEMNGKDPLRMFNTIVVGARRAFDFAVEKKVARVLHLSSGAVYGQQPWEITHVGEDWPGAPDCSNPLHAYAEGKRAAEMLGAIYGRQFGLNVSTARIFAVLGPLLPLGAHFAAGNFIRDATAGRKIAVQSDGRACRSYLYAADLTAALWLMLVHGPSGRAFNLGSDQTVSICELAQRVNDVLGGKGYEILGKPNVGWNPGRYVPDMSNFVAEFGPVQSVALSEAIWRTAKSNGWSPCR